METIDMTPNREELARIYSYVLMTYDIGNHDLGSYWNYTEAEQDVIIKAWELFEKYTDFWESVGIEMRHVPVSHRTKAVRACITAAKIGETY